ncbi:hypothetical protein RUM44_006348 [Polyplax serrata]|uniref:Uncharacterized protein n=1 Tax=Polyplax serrata TaxID=468196 RepID=A0ABR1AHU6_POLSC
MKAQQRSLLTTPGAQVKPSKTKKSKGNKKRTEKSPEVNSTDLQRNLKAPTEAKEKNTIPKLMGLIDNSVDVMTDIKKNQRKQDANEWKSIKKVECQRLETVLEEGQLSSEETPSKQGGPEDCSNSGSYMDCEPFPDAAEQTENKRTNEVNGVSDKGEFNKTEEECEDRQKQTSDKGDFPDDERYKEPIVRQQEGQLDEKAVAAKWNINLNGMMEIYPIFSNDRFLCSRDAISIQEYDDIEPLEKHRSLTGAKTNEFLIYASEKREN